MAIKVLVASFKADGDKENKFVPVMVDSLIKKGIDVTWSSEEFWNPTKKYDIIHFQWPEAIGVYKGPEGLAALTWRIKAWKDVGGKMVITRHNEIKHYNNDPFYKDLYRLVESSCDAILHMGEYSRNTIPKENCPDDVEHVIVPHHIYPEINRSYSIVDARKKLGINLESSIVLAFGGIRADEERVMLMKAMKCLKHKKIQLIVPRLFQNNILGVSKYQMYMEIRNRLRFIKYGFFFHTGGLVSEERMSLLFSACDVVLIPRIRILNSGNLPMGFYFGKVVVGPNRGNVGEILEKTGNPIYEPESEQSLIEAINKGFDLTRTGKGKLNQSYANDNWNPEKVTQIIVNTYQKICHRD